MESRAPDLSRLIEKLEGHLAELEGLLEKKPDKAELHKASENIASAIRALRAGEESAPR